jgi:DNA-binding response OmpR family regulator
MTERPRLELQRQNQRPHVLIVCDEPSLSEFLAEGLPHGGFWTSVIASGLQAIEVFRLRQFDIVVIYAGLTSFSWIELVRRLRGVSTRVAQGDVRTTAPIVLVSDQAVSVDEAERKALGVEAIQVAPLELDEVVRTLHSTFELWQGHHPDLPLADFRSGILE